MCRVIGRGFAWQDDSHLPMVWRGKVKADCRKPSPETKRYPAFRAVSLFMFFPRKPKKTKGSEWTFWPPAIWHRQQCKTPSAIRNSFGKFAKVPGICVGCKSHHRWASIISTKQRVCPCRSLMPGTVVVVWFSLGFRWAKSLPANFSWRDSYV